MSLPFIQSSILNELAQQIILLYLLIRSRFIEQVDLIFFKILIFFREILRRISIKKTQKNEIKVFKEVRDDKKQYKNIKDFVSGILRYPDFANPWLVPAIFRGTRVVLNHNIDFIFATGMPWSSFIVGYFIKIFTRKKLIIDFRDPWVNNPYMNIGKQEKYLDKKWESIIVKKADLVIANTEPLKKEMRNRYKNIKDKFIVLPNGYDVDDFQSISKIGSEGSKLVISHAGLLYPQRDPGALLKAIEKINNTFSEYANTIQINQIGNIDLGYDLPEYCKNKKIDNYFNFITQLDHKLCLRHLSASDILLVIQPGTKTQVPSKLYEYIYLGKPIVAITQKDGALGQLITNYGFGDVFEPDEHHKIAEYIINMVKQKNETNLLNKNEYKNKKFFDARYIASCLNKKLMEFCS